MENKKIKILAIDDNRDNLITLKAIISEVIPQSVVYAEESGQRGIESARKNNPDVILLDIIMPVMDGYQVCKTLKADEQLSETPIIFLTALTGDKQSRILALEAGGEAFLAKPIDATELKAQILAMLKIKEAAAYKRNEKLRLEELVKKQTEELVNANIAALNLLEDLNAEIEIRKQSEEELKISKELLSETESIGKVGGWSFNIDTMEQKWTDEVYRIHEVEISSSPSVDAGINYYTNESRPIINKAVQRAIEHGENYDLELEIITAKGNTRAVHTIGKADLKNRRINGFFQDITEHKRAEEKLKLLNRAVEASSVAVEITDAEGNINYVNPFFTELTGYSYEEARGKNPRFLKSGNHPKEFYKDLWDNILSGKDWTGEFQNKKKNGELYWVKAVITPILNSNGKVANFVAIKEDITQSKKILQELIAAKLKAEESDQLKTSFLHNISHEIRTPLNSIVGFSEILTDPNLVPDVRRHFSDIIVKSSDQLLSIINDIISISTIEAGQEKLVLKNTNVNSKCKLIYEQFSVRAKNNNTTLRFDTPLADSDATILLDETKFMQILTNLLDNAFKYISQGHVYFGYNLKNDFLEFYVEDTGIGIHSDMHEEIFKRFRQVEVLDNRQYGGSGLGLSISKAYVELHGGEIWLKSEIGKGSVFYFTVPYKLEKQDSNSENQIVNEITLANNTPITVLIAEDEDFNFMLVEELLSGSNFNIIRVINGFEAVEICKTNKNIDLILMDIKMPLMDGYEATKQIKQFLPNLPIIAQTACSTEADKNKALTAGCDDFISKPFKQVQLISKIIEKTNKK